MVLQVYRRFAHTQVGRQQVIMVISSRLSTSDSLAQSFSWSNLFDHGFVVKNQNPWNDEAATGNYVQLSGVGVGGTWNLPGLW